MKFRFLLYFILVFAVFSCFNPKPLRDELAQEHRLPPSLPLQRSMPDLRIRDYKNREAGAAMASWLRSYLNNDMAAVESQSAYNGTYLFVASVRNANAQVVTQWIGNFSADRDFSRLAAERIRSRLEQNLTISPDDFYGSNYEKAVKAAYTTPFWGAQRRDDSWIWAAESENGSPLYWGFILVSIPKDTLEIQVNAILKGIEDSGKKAAGNQNSAFEDVREHFFEQF